jgi:diguanylate cyclase (GGDEF)-like protein
MVVHRLATGGRRVRLTSHRMSAILDAHVAISAIELSPGAVQREICEQALSLVGGDGAVVEMRRGDEMEYVGAAGAGVAHLGLRMPVAGSISRTCLSERTALLCTDTESDPRVNLEACRRVGVRSVVLAPLRHRDVVVGVLKVFAATPHRFTRQDEATLALLAAPFGAAMDNARQMTEAVQVASIDGLTGLNNRAQALRHLDRVCLRQRLLGGHTAVLFLDLDGFKAVNDGRGHECGDAVLTAVATRIAICVREKDVAARFGGDEFLVICEQLATSGDASGVAERLVSEISRPYLLPDGDTVQLGVSIGIAVTDEDVDPRALVDAADQARYRAKRSGGGYAAVRLMPELAVAAATV